MPTLHHLYRQALSHAPSPFEAGELFRFITGADPISPDLDTPAPPAMQSELTRLLELRAQGYPLQYMLGSWEFYGLPFYVGPGVLIPRQDTETLVDTALDILKNAGKTSPELLDLCSGSGCIAIAIKHSFPQAKVTALEASADAYTYLEKNTTLNAVDITCTHADLRDYKHPAPLDMIVSNPPYIPHAELPGLQTEVTHEPAIALDGGQDGLNFYREIARRYRQMLAPGGQLLLEIGAGQQDDVTEILTSHGFVSIKQQKDLNAITRVLAGTT